MVAPVLLSGSRRPRSEGASAITDVRIRVEPDPEGGFRDVVTYCGISAFGDHVSEDTALTPRLRLMHLCP